MNEEALRYQALKMALGHTQLTGLACPACIVKEASIFAAFLKDGSLSTEHIGGAEADDEITFTPDDRNLN